MAQKPSIPKGTRDFSSTEVSKRQYIIQIIKTNFEKFGFQPIETPSIENSETLLGKYGEEGDRLIFKILNSGNFFYNKSKIEVPSTIADLQQFDADKLTLDQRIELNQFTNKISEKALRYDLTVPFARYVVQHQNELQFPFKRYQIQPVWRADRPQKGRFREFFQCDADVVGSDSLWQEIEFVQLYDSVFADLKLDGVTIKINNRKILSGIAEIIGASDKLIDFTVALDKLDKIGKEGVETEMLQKGIQQDSIDKIQPLFTFHGSVQEKIEKLSVLLKNSIVGTKGVSELKFICDSIQKLGLQTCVLDLDITLARGLNYYTGAIFEVSAPATVPMGSVGGGGRYDDLTGIFGLKNMSGVGISFGLDRIYLVLEALNLFPETATTNTTAIFINNGDTAAFYAMQAILMLRKNGIKVELYPDNVKVAKQFQYAEKRNIPFVVNVEATDMPPINYTLKNLFTGQQNVLSVDELLVFLKP